MLDLLPDVLLDRDAWFSKWFLNNEHFHGFLSQLFLFFDNGCLRHLSLVLTIFRL